MILVVVTCLVLRPAACTHTSITLPVAEMDPAACLMAATPVFIQWSKLNQMRRVRSARCAVPTPRGHKDI
jgi:hypothetical protein